MRFVFVLIFAILSMSAAASATPAVPENDGLMTNYSDIEKIGFAYYYLIHQNPPFERWIQDEPDYMRAAPNVRLGIMDKQRSRLQYGFASFQPGQDFIHLRISGKIRVFGSSGGAKDNQNDDTALRTLEITFPTTQNTMYFPAQIGDLSIAIIPSDLTPTTTYPITLDQYNKLCPPGSNCGLVTHTMTIDLTLRARSADAKTPMEFNGTPLWLMLCDVGVVRIFDRDKQILWENDASWYNAGQSQQLMTLFNK